MEKVSLSNNNASFVNFFFFLKILFQEKKFTKKLNFKMKTYFYSIGLHKEGGLNILKKFKKKI